MMDLRLKELQDKLNSFNGPEAVENIKEIMRHPYNLTDQLQSFMLSLIQTPDLLRAVNSLTDSFKSIHLNSVS
jgi:hypothetical protein